MTEKYFELPDYCEVCSDRKDNEVLGCIICARSVCADCIDMHLSDWECICKECGW